MPIIESDDLLREYERTGCAHTFEKIVAEHRPYVLSICSRITGNAHDAEDGTQAVFLTLSLQARGGNNINTLRPWLAQVARHVSLDLCKARKRRQNHEQAAMREETQPQGRSATDEKELQHIIREQIESLPPRYRTPMILFYFGGMSLPQIGQQLGVTRKALSVRLLRARRMLAQSLSQSKYPWFSVGAVPLLLEEAIRSGMWDMTTAAAAPKGRLVASLTPSFFNFGFPGGLKRNIFVAAIALTGLSSMAGSASIAWLGGSNPFQLELPSFADWLGKKLDSLTNIKVPMRAQTTPVKKEEAKTQTVQVYHPVPLLNHSNIAKHPVPQKLVVKPPTIFSGPDIALSNTPAPINRNTVVNGNISSNEHPANQQTARARNNTSSLPAIASVVNHSSHDRSATGTAATPKASDAVVAMVDDSGSQGYSTMPGEIEFDMTSTGSVSYVRNGYNYDSSANYSMSDSSVIAATAVGSGKNDITYIPSTNVWGDVGLTGASIGDADSAVVRDITVTGIAPQSGLPEPTILGFIGITAAILGPRKRRRTV